jgi:hypothetical protein
MLIGVGSPRRPATVFGVPLGAQKSEPVRKVEAGNPVLSVVGTSGLPTERLKRNDVSPMPSSGQNVEMVAPAR